MGRDLFYLQADTWPPRDGEGPRAYLYLNSWSYESSGTTVADVANLAVAVARANTGIYTHTFPSSSKPTEIQNVHCSFSLPGRSCTWDYVYSTGILTVTVYAVDGDGVWAAANTDEEIIKLTAVCYTE